MRGLIGDKWDAVALLRSTLMVRRAKGAHHCRANNFHWTIGIARLVALGCAPIQLAQVHRR